jgi:hypothetical protein
MFCIVCTLMSCTQLGNCKCLHLLLPRLPPLLPLLLPLPTLQPVVSVVTTLRQV